MRTIIRMAFCGLLAAIPLPPALGQPVPGQQAGGAEGHRIQGGGINYAPRPAVYSVMAVDAYARIVRLRAADGWSGEVFVPEDIYDLDKLQAGDRVRVDFLAARTPDGELSAASIWPAR